MTEEECGDLHILREETSISSFWKPEPEELAALNKGLPIMLTCLGHSHPPISLEVLAPSTEQSEEETQSNTQLICSRAMPCLASIFTLSGTKESCPACEPHIEKMRDTSDWKPYKEKFWMKEELQLHQKEMIENKIKILTKDLNPSE
jgi:hypothetical protein